MCTQARDAGLDLRWLEASRGLIQSLAVRDALDAKEAGDKVKVDKIVTGSDSMADSVLFPPVPSLLSLFLNSQRFYLVPPVLPAIMKTTHRRK